MGEETLLESCEGEGDWATEENGECVTGEIDVPDGDVGIAEGEVGVTEVGGKAIVCAGEEADVDFGTVKGGGECVVTERYSEVDAVGGSD